VVQGTIGETQELLLLLLLLWVPPPLLMAEQWVPTYQLMSFVLQVLVRHDR
jgi:hypothetical protein